MNQQLKHMAARSVLLISLWLLATTTFAQTAPTQIGNAASAPSHSMTALGPRRTASEPPEPDPESARTKKRNRRIGISIGVTLGTMILLGAGFVIGAAAAARSMNGPPDIQF